MKKFIMNGILWRVLIVPFDSSELIDRTGTLTLGTTDPVNNTIYISDSINDSMKKRVIAHEMGHAACFSYGLIKEIHSYCKPSKRIALEEFVCNFVADYGEEIFKRTYEVLGDDAIYYMPGYYERIVA